MNLPNKSAVVALFCLSVALPVFGAAEIQGKGHRFACVDYSGHKAFIVSAEGRVEWECPGIGNPNDLWVLPNGNTVMSNWLGHGKFGTAPQVIEVTPDKQVVWTFADHTTMKTISSLQILDVPGNPLEGTVVH